MAAHRNRELEDRIESLLNSPVRSKADLASLFCRLLGFEYVGRALSNRDNSNVPSSAPWSCNSANAFPPRCSFLPTAPPSALNAALAFTSSTPKSAAQPPLTMPASD